MSTLEKPPAIGTDYESIFQIVVSNGPLLSEFFQAYPYWAKLKHKAKAMGFEAPRLWTAVKYHRASQASRLHLHDDFSFNLPASLMEGLHNLDMHCGGSLQSDLGPLPERVKDRFIISSLLTEAFSSSTLEGAVSTRDRAKELIRQGKKPRNKSERMVVNNYLAMEFLREHRTADLTLPLLMELHSILSKDALDQGEAGRFRDATEDVHIFDDLNGELIYTPPAAAQISERMSELIVFFNHQQSGLNAMASGREQVFIHPILRATIVHFMVGYIHPFTDGNGRMARALFYWHMLRNGYWLAEYLSISQIILESRSQYYRAFLEVEQDENDLTYFLLYHTKVLIRAFESLKAYLDRKLRQQHINHVDEARRLEILPRQAQLLEAIRKSATIWTIAQAQTYLNTSYGTARADLIALADRKLLELYPLNKKTQGYRAILH